MTTTRLFVGGIPAGTGDADLRRHFSRYGEVADVCLPRSVDRLTGRPRHFAFVQFTLPSDAGRALADQRHHVINGRQVRVARAEPRRHVDDHHGVPPQRKPTCKVGRWRYRVGDMVRLSFGPLGENYQECESVSRIIGGFGFGSVVDNVSIFDCTIGYISEDAKERPVRWSPQKQSDAKAGYPGQRCIPIPRSYGSLQEFA